MAGIGHLHTLGAILFGKLWMSIVKSIISVHLSAVLSYSLHSFSMILNIFREGPFKYWVLGSKESKVGGRRQLVCVAQHLSSIPLSNVSFCAPILGTKNGTCLSDGPALCGFQKRTLTYSFLRGLAAPVIRKVRVLCYEFTDMAPA